MAKNESGLAIHKAKMHIEEINVQDAGNPKVIPKAHKAIPIKCKLHKTKHCTVCGHSCTFCPQKYSTKQGPEGRLIVTNHYAYLHGKKGKFPELKP